MLKCSSVWEVYGWDFANEKQIVAKDIAMSICTETEMPIADPWTTLHSSVLQWQVVVVP